MLSVSDGYFCVQCKSNNISSPFFVTVSSKPGDGVRAVDIVPLLRERPAFLSGGRDKRGGPILVFPAHTNIDKLPHDDLKTVISYLTAVPR